MKQSLDVLTIGRASVDLYGGQVGGRLEDMRSFDKYLGGCPTNIAVGAARLGLATGLITRVGDEHMGRFIREQLQAEGVDVRGVTTDPERLTALVLLGIRDQQQFPLIFYREDCADMALDKADIDPELLADVRCLTVTGTHLSNPRTEAAVMKAIRLAANNGARLALDIDYRPNLWGLAGHGAGEARYIESPVVTARLQETLGKFDLIVGTEEEFHIAGGSSDTVAALHAVRTVTDAVLVCKRGPMGATVFTGEVSDSLDDGIAGPAFAVEVFNVLGAGDGFMAGLLKGWLSDSNWTTTLTYANACGALAVSRHGCAPAYPSLDELQFFLEHGIVHASLRHDLALAQIHWSTNRLQRWPELRVLAFDHRSQFETMEGSSPARIAAFKLLCLQAVERVAQGRSGYGVLCDGRFGRDALHRAAGQGLWIGRPVESPGSRPLKIEPELGLDFGALGEWPKEHVVKVLCFCHPGDDEALWSRQIITLQRLFSAARRQNLEFLLELIPSKVAMVDELTTPAIIKRIYAAHIYPDWWKLEPQNGDAAWQAVCKTIKRFDAHVRGIVLLGLDAPADELVDGFTLAARHDLVKGFAVGRTIFGESARRWMRKEIDDAEAVATMRVNYSALCSTWDQARRNARDS